MQQGCFTSPEAKRMKGHNAREKLNERLDEALEESFPASDPPAVHRTDCPPDNADEVRPGGPTGREKPKG